MNEREAIVNKISDLVAEVCKFNTESFAGFFAYFIKRRPDSIVDIELNKFDSKLKDFFYLIALNVFAEERGLEDFDFSPKLIGELADKVNAIKDHYRVAKFTDYTMDAVIHEMAFRNHFDNGVLSYVEQDLEKIRTVFLPFDNKIQEVFGFDVDFLIEVYKMTELTSQIRFGHIMEFTHTKEFQAFHEKTHSGKISFSEAIESLSESTRNALLSFHAKTHAYLLFSREDLYHTLPENKVDKFLEIFSCKPGRLSSYKYYTDNNPLELAPILQLSENKYLHICQKQIPIAVYRVLYDSLSKDAELKDKLRRHREKSLEKKVTEIFKSFFGAKAFYYENYFVEKGHEQDLLIIYKGTAIIVETKASKLREPFRDIDRAVVRLKDDFKDAVQAGYNQCKRAEAKFIDDDHFDIMDSKGNILYRVDPSKINNVYNIVVTLERFGSLQTDLGLFLQKDEADNYPWSVYIDDLEIFLLTLKHHSRNGQGKFGDFLRSRQLLHGHVYAIDELDICASFFKDPNKFSEHAKRKDTLVNYSPLEQALFDEIYHSGGLRFKEEPMPDFHRYFVKKKSSSI